MDKNILYAAPRVRLHFIPTDSWPSIFCVKGFKAAKKIIEHTALSLKSKPQSVYTESTQT